MGQGLVILVTPILTRKFDSGEFAFLAVYTAVTLVVGPSIVLRMDMALGLPDSDRSGVAVAWLGGLAALTLSFVFWLTCLAFGRTIATALHSPEFAHLQWLIALGVFLLAVDQISIGWMVRKKSYSAIAWRNLVAGLAQAATQVLFAYMNVADGLIYGLVIGRLVAVGGLFGSAGLLRHPFPRPSELKAVAYRYRRFLYISSWSTLLNSLGVQAPVLVISACYGKESVAALGLAIRVLSAPLAVVGLAVGRVFQGHVAESMRLDRVDLVSRLRSTAKLLGSLGAAPTLVLILSGPAIFARIFGAEWRAAGDLAAILAAGLFAQFIVSPISQVPTLLERQVLQIRWDMVRLAATVCLPMVAWWAGADIKVAVLVLSFTFLLMYGSFYVMSDRLAADRDRKLSSRIRFGPVGR